MTHENSPSFPRGLIMMLVSGACFVAVLIALVVGGRLLEDEIVTSWAGPIAIDAPTTHSAGDVMTIRVAANAPPGTSLQLAVFAPLSATMLEQPLQGGVASFEIDGKLLQHAGLYQLVARIEGSTSEPHQVQVWPDEPVDPVVPLVGPRTIIADGADITMTVVTPIDQFGNPVANGTAVDIEVLRPNGDRSTEREQVERGIAATILTATTETGRVTISATSGQAEGPNNVVDQVAGSPAPFSVEADLRNPLADDFTLHQVQTSELRDQFGNLLPDGVAVVFVVQSTQGTSFVHASVQGGIARAAIQAPDRASELTLVARVSGAQSAPTILRFEPAVDVVVAVLSASDDSVTLTIGPVLTARGGYVPDGTIALISDPESGEILRSIALRGGTAVLDIEMPSRSLDVAVLGASTTVDLEGS